MKQRPWFLLWAFILLAACGGGEKEPDAPMDRARFERVLAGSLLIEARLAHEAPVEGISKDASLAYYQELFEHEGVTGEDFKATYEAYMERPELLRDVYRDVLIRLQQQADSISQ